MRLRGIDRRTVCVWSVCLLGAGCTLMLASCGGDPKEGGRLKTVKVEGDVSINGSAPEGLDVVLISDTPLKNPSGSRTNARPAGLVDDKGHYVLSTYQQRDGAPPAKYKIKLIWTKSGGLMKSQLDGPDRLNDQFRDEKANAENDERFIVTIPETDDSDSVFTIPKIELEDVEIDAAAAGP